MFEKGKFEVNDFSVNLPLRHLKTVYNNLYNVMEYNIIIFILKR